MASSKNQIMVAQARDAMDRFKMEAAQEVGVQLKQGYNGDLTSRQAGSVGGQMVKKMTPMRTIEVRRRDRSKAGHGLSLKYLVSLEA